jgi:molecular chaperone GrpE
MSEKSVSDGAGASPPPGAPDGEQPQAIADEAAEQVAEDLDELGAAKQERDEYLELAQRTKADFDNYRKRVAKEASEALARGRAELARDLVPVLDNLERALQAAGIDPEDAGGGEADAPSRELSARDALARGVALVLRELRAALAAAGVEDYDPVGESFDPSWHEAISTRPAAADGARPGTVVETLERGYRLNGQVIRPARVVVSE